MKIKLRDDDTRTEMDNEIEFINVEISGYSYVEEIRKMLQLAMDEGDHKEYAVLAQSWSQLMDIKND